jgi:hypothetical protein
MTELLGEEVQLKRARKTGPTGKVHKVFEEVSKFPRRQQPFFFDIRAIAIADAANNTNKINWSLVNIPDFMIPWTVVSARNLAALKRHRSPQN